MGRTACTEAQCLYKGDLYLYIKTVNTLEVDRQFSASVAVSVQCTVSHLRPCIQFISLETWVSDNSTKEVTLNRGADKF